jgi:hypothetical protein
MVIGFRADPDGFVYVLLDGSQEHPTLVSHDRLELPAKCSWPGALSWVRKQVDEIVEAHAPDHACIKTIEPIAKTKSTQRIQIEAVIQEYLYTRRKIKCSCANKSQIKRAIPSFTEPARYLERLVEMHESMAPLNTPLLHEAAAAALSLLPEE